MGGWVGIYMYELVNVYVGEWVYGDWPDVWMDFQMDGCVNEIRNEFLDSIRCILLVPYMI